MILTESLLDRETTPSYKFNAFATDKGTPPQTATVSIEITISDVDDNRPTIQFSNSVQSFTEGGPSVTVIVEGSAVTISDLDDMSLFGVFRAVVYLRPSMWGYSTFPLPGG